MKFFKIYFSLILLCLVTSSTISQTFKDPSAYLDFVGKEEKLITKNMWNYTKAIAHSKSDRNINTKLKVLIKTVERAILKINRATGYDGNDYKNQVLKHLNFNLSLLNEDYSKIIDMKAVAEQSYDAMEAYMLAQEMADKKLEESQQEYESNFYAYANKHNIKIVEGETDLGKKMAISNEVFKHYKEMYLIYFKVYINEVYLMDALEKSDVGAIQQSANALSESAKDGLNILKNVELYKNDNSLITSTKAVFNFFIDEADTKIPVLTDFLILSENLETIKNTLEKTPERKRTKKQIDSYNAKVKEFNKSVKNYNKINSELNNKRQLNINKLNESNQRFLSKHIPND